MKKIKVMIYGYMVDGFHVRIRSRTKKSIAIALSKGVEGERQ
jgi:hypothetical protein